MAQMRPREGEEGTLLKYPNSNPSPRKSRLVTNVTPRAHLALAPPSPTAADPATALATSTLAAAAEPAAASPASLPPPPPPPPPSRPPPKPPPATLATTAEPTAGPPSPHPPRRSAVAPRHPACRAPSAPQASPPPRHHRHQPHAARIAAAQPLTGSGPVHQMVSTGSHRFDQARS
jgi:hypothetical protein